MFVLVLAFLAGIVQFGLISIAFDRLGLSPVSAYLLLLGTLGGSLINLPLFSLTSDRREPLGMTAQWGRWPLLIPPLVTNKTVVAVNVGGAVVPISFSLYLFTHTPLTLGQVAAAVAVVAVIARMISRPIPSVGIGMPVLVAPIAAALIATLLNAPLRAPLAYIGGSLGVLIGADLLRLNDIRKLGAPVASIGGAGTFDGIFLTGLVAVLLA